MTEITCVVDAKAELGESTYWDPVAQRLWWVDIWGPTIYRFDPATGTNESFTVPEYLGCVAVRAKGGLVITMASGFYFFDPDSGRLDKIGDPEADLPDNRFNDGKTDRQGRFWSGAMFEAPGKARTYTAGLWRLDQDLSLTKTLGGIGCSNGLAWSPDSRTMYFTDSFVGGEVRAYDFDPATGAVENRRSFCDVTHIAPDAIVDGSTVDAEGCYWLTVPFKGKVLRYDPDGRLMRTIDLPFDLPTCCEFGGPDLGTLYVTSATLRRGPDVLGWQPQAGGLFALDVGAKGLPLVPFAG
jgi:sugar lactone lactonase YvrE